MKDMPRKPHRLEQIFDHYTPPLYFITFCTHQRRHILNNKNTHEKFIQFATQSASHGAVFGRYVIMPDHIHFFLRIAQDQKLATTIRLLKRSLSSAISTPAPHWQPGYFDRLLRHSESYSEKWHYVQQNPVRAGLTDLPENWPYQGEIFPIHY